MKTFILIAIFFVSISTTYSQLDANTKDFVNSFERKFSVPAAFIRDSCATEAILLRLNIDRNYKVTLVQFSDNASQAFHDELKRVSQQFDVQSLEAYCRNKKYKGFSFVFSVLFINKGLPCKAVPNPDLQNKRYNRFNGKNLSGNIFLADPINIVIEVINT